MTNVYVEKLICCIREGHEAYTRFLNDRLKEKSLSTHSTISNCSSKGHLESSIQIPPVKRFHYFAIVLTSMITKAGHNSDKIHIVFDNYREDSIKNGERDRRAKSKEMVALDAISPNQNVSVILENFWSSSTSKSVSKHSMLNGSPPIIVTPNLYILVYAWMVSAGYASVFPQLNSTHEEANVRMMFHVQDMLSRPSGPTSMTLLSGDTDVLMCLP